MVNKKIVIIGGGFTGALCAKKLEKDKNFQVTLIDNKPYFEYTPGILRTILEPQHCQKIQRLHKEYLSHTALITDKVIDVSTNYVQTKKKQKVPYDYLIIASGSNYALPIKERSLIPAIRAKELAKYHNKLKKAKKVLIIGGGLVGVELAAEICTHYRDKNITLVHSRDALMERNHVKTQQYAKKFLEKHNVRIIFNERVEKTDGQEGKRKHFVTNKGTNLHADMAFICVGITPNYAFMLKNYKDTLNEKNQIQINEYLQLSGNVNIFVGGDVTSIAEEKTAQASKKHAGIIVKNIYNLEKNKPLLEYKTKKRPMVISLGKYGGIFENGNFIMTGKFPAFLKWLIEWRTMWQYG